MVKKSPNPIDIHVGSRVRLRRMLVGLSQDKLGEALGLTFQQIQKYEKGVNRIGASRLFQISKILTVPVSFFFDDMPGEETGLSGFAEGGEADPAFMDFINSSEGVQLCRHYSQITDPKVRKRIFELIRSLAEEEVAAIPAQ
ncbi:MAG: helix-turn-helix transcriptional regulator [Pseudomonadota bacterium]